MLLLLFNQRLLPLVPSRSLLYPRMVSITRPIPDTGVGAQPYSGLTKVGETVVVSNIPANVQNPTRTRSGASEAGLPGDTSSKISIDILLPGTYSILGQITERDIATDDLGKRYQVVAAIWGVTGYTLLTTLLEA
jgi:hypothetical protein